LKNITGEKDGADLRSSQGDEISMKSYHTIGNTTLNNPQNNKVQGNAK
jgi:hypothetical protein